MKSSLLSKFILSSFVGGLIILQVGCAGKYTGGGFIPSAADPDKKANFGFNFQAIDIDGDGRADGPLDEHKGRLLYHDSAAGVAIKGDVDFAVILDDPSLPNFYGLAVGTYVNQPLNGGSAGSFQIEMYDLGEPGADSDFFFILLADNDGNIIYINSGFIEGGNIQYHPPE
jgi:hypothetical protein